MIHHWALDTPCNRTATLIGVTAEVVHEWFARMREICEWYNSRNPYTVGGPGIIVEIDEAAVNHANPHAG